MFALLLVTSLLNFNCDFCAKDQTLVAEVKTDSGGQRLRQYQKGGLLSRGNKWLGAWMADTSDVVESGVDLPFLLCMYSRLQCGGSVSRERVSSQIFKAAYRMESIDQANSFGSGC